MGVSLCYWFSASVQHSIQSKCNTYVERLLQHNPAGLRLDFEVIQILRIVRRRQTVNDGAIVVGILVGSGDAQNVGANAGILFHVLDVFLGWGFHMLVHRIEMPPLSGSGSPVDRTAADCRSRRWSQRWTSKHLPDWVRPDRWPSRWPTRICRRHPRDRTPCSWTPRRFPRPRWTWCPSGLVAGQSSISPAKKPNEFVNNGRLCAIKLTHSNSMQTVAVVWVDVCECLFSHSCI